jgi:hypothetical protein
MTTDARKTDDVDLNQAQRLLVVSTASAPSWRSPQNHLLLEAAG